MRKDFWLFILVLAIAIPYFWLKFRPEPNINDIFKPVHINMDPDGSIHRRYVLYYIIDSLLGEQNCRSAESKIDSALYIDSIDNRLIDLKGQSLMCKGNNRESLKWFNKAIDKGMVPRSLGNRALAYSELKIFDSAIHDLKECANINSGYNKDLGIVYEKTKQVDSSIKYFQLYLSDHPDSIRIQQILLKLTTGG
jgi:tetratricopeptide (TPR) repeat protein